MPDSTSEEIAAGDDLPRRLWTIYGERVSTAEWYRRYFGGFTPTWDGIDEVTKQAWRDVATALRKERP